MTNATTPGAALATGRDVSAQAQSDQDRAVLEAFYARFCTASPQADRANQAETLFAQDFVSIGDPAGKGNKTGAQLVQTMDTITKIVPDLTFAVAEILQSGPRYIVRCRVTGTPAAPLFGVDGKGKSFEIMSIDIHEMKAGKMARVYHIEDWAGALRQLSAP